MMRAYKELQQGSRSEYWKDAEDTGNNCIVVKDNACYKVDTGEMSLYGSIDTR